MVGVYEDNTDVDKTSLDNEIQYPKHVRAEIYHCYDTQHVLRMYKNELLWIGHFHSSYHTMHVCQVYNIITVLS